MKIVIPGRPIPAVRMTGRGKYIKHNAQRYINYKNQIGWLARTKTNNPTSKDVEVVVNVFLYGKTTRMGKDGDVDNYLKSACDGLNKIVWNDDRQVIKASVQKIPCKRSDERMEIEIKAIDKLAG